MPTTLLTTESRRLTEQDRLDRQKDAAERNRWGQFATPPQLALDIARHAFALWPTLWPARPAEPVTFLDPAIGTGSSLPKGGCVKPLPEPTPSSGPPASNLRIRPSPPPPGRPLGHPPACK